jgi:hypothetical protein
MLVMEKVQAEIPLDSDSDSEKMKGGGGEVVPVLPLQQSWTELALSSHGLWPLHSDR